MTDLTKAAREPVKLSVAERLARYWTATNCQGEYLYSSLDLREDTAAELRRLAAEVEALRAELAKCGPRWADGGDAMAGALAGM